MQISNNFSVSGADALRSASKASAPNEGQTLAKAGGIQEPVDLIELSPEALSQMREAIAAGKYDTDEMLEKAFDRMLDRYL